MRNRSGWLFLGLLVSLAGCFPIDLDVNDRGQILIPRQEGFFLFDPAKSLLKPISNTGRDQPVFGRFSPNGKDVLLVVKDSQTGLFRFEILPIESGRGRRVFSSRDTAYVSFSPDGKQLCVVRASEKANPKFKQPTPELVVVPANLETESSKAEMIASDVGIIFRWFADGKRILAFQFTDKDEKTNRILGNLAIVDIATKKVTPIATAWTDQRIHLDLSPDNKTALFTAVRAGKAGVPIDVPAEGEMKVFEVDISSASLRDTEVFSNFVRYSPTGKKVLLVQRPKLRYDGTDPQPFSFENMDLIVADANLGNASRVARDAFYKQFTTGSEGITFPGWINDDTMFFYIERANFGTQAKSIWLATLSSDGKTRKILQPHIDLGVVQTGETVENRLAPPKKSQVSSRAPDLVPRHVDSTEDYLLRTGVGCGALFVFSLFAIVVGSAIKSMKASKDQAAVLLT